MTSQSSGYTISEDVLLCQVYLDISQDPITGRYQSANEFWSRMQLKYNELRQQYLEYRNIQSLRSRMDTINSEVKRLNECLKQVENLNPSGASEEDIVSIIFSVNFNLLILGVTSLSLNLSPNVNVCKLSA